MTAAPFDPRDTTAVADRGRALDLLRDGDLDPVGLITEASNHTVLCRLGPAADKVYAIYKPRAGERPLWDFPRGTLCQREVAAYEVSTALGWGLVPPTVLRAGPSGEGSVQLFVPHDPSEHYFTLIEDPARHQELTRLAVFDLLINNADRKGSHMLIGAHDGALHAIDNGLTFHVQPKLRTVVWDLGPAPLQTDWHADLLRLAAALDDAATPGLCLTGLLAPGEVGMLARRARELARLTALPEVQEDYRPYPWPPL